MSIEIKCEKCNEYIIFEPDAETARKMSSKIDSPYIAIKEAVDEGKTHTYHIYEDGLNQDLWIEELRGKGYSVKEGYWDWRNSCITSNPRYQSGEDTCTFWDKCLFIQW